jgi:hypothetical protein
VTNRIDDYRGALAYAAPFLIEKIVKERLASTPQEAEELFLEVKRFLVMSCATDLAIEMYSTRIDEVWHQFVLYSWEYMSFCRQYFGHYLHHSPSNAPKIEGRPIKHPLSLGEFAHEYQLLFGVQMPDIWHDDRSVTLDRRAICSRSVDLSVKLSGDEVSLTLPNGTEVFSVNSVARDAVAFVATGSPFYVRELPGDLLDDEKIALVSTLVQQSLLKTY